MIERGFVLFASCASEPSAKPVCLWHKPLKANSVDTSMANEQDTSLVVPAIKREPFVGSFLMAEMIVARIAKSEFGGFPYVLSEAKSGKRWN